MTCIPRPNYCRCAVPVLLMIINVKDGLSGNTAGGVNCLGFGFELYDSSKPMKMSLRKGFKDG